MESTKEISQIGYIYSLVDPTNNQVRYLGQSVQPAKWRLAQHISTSKKSNDHKSNWIKSLLSKNLRPILHVVSFHRLEDLNQIEAEIIAKHRLQYGTRIILNADDGGNAEAKTRLHKKVVRSDGKTFDSIREAALEINSTAPQVVNCLKGKCHWIKGFGFRYYSGISETWTPKFIQGKPVIRSDGVTYCNGKEAAKANGITTSTLSAAIKNNGLVAKTYRFKFKNLEQY